MYAYTIGMVPMPPDFRYRDVFLKGKPQHGRLDAFRLRHPKMSNGRRAKLFSPFDALKGFSEAVSAKDVLYEDRVTLAPEDAEALDRQLSILHSLTWNGRMARTNQVRVEVTYFEPCSDINHEAYGYRGRYRTADGICMNVDAEVTKTILVDRTRIPLDAVRKIAIRSGNNLPESSLPPDREQGIPEETQGRQGGTVSYDV